VMYGLRLNSRLTMKKGEFQEVALAGANIRRNLYLIEAKFNGELDLKLAKIGSVTSDNIEVESLDLTGTQVDNVVVKVPSIENFTEQPKSQGFPKQLKSQGFTYNQFLIQKKNNAKLNQDEREKLYKEWLNRLEKYNPQPYDMAAKVMRENGYPELATDLLFASKEKERIRACDDKNIPRCAGLWLLRLTTGYGLGARLLFRPLLWLIVFVLLGAFVYSRSPIDKIETDESRKWVGWMAFSVDMILPLIRLREEHYNNDLEHDWQRYYFYIHQLFGWLMASFIFAGLAGITQG